MPPLQKIFRPEKPQRGTKCLNCGFETDAPFCSECGQENEVLKMGFKDIVKDALEEFVKFDSKFIETLRPLAFKPGFLTKEWVIGRRVRYISPFKLYLTATFLFFLIAGIKNPASNLNVSSSKSSKVNVNADEGDVPPVLRPIVSKFKRLDQLPSEAIGPAILEHGPQALFFALPFFALCFKLAYLRSNRLYIEHLVFVLHNHAFYFFTLSLSELITFFDATNVAAIVCLVYSLLALKNYYGQKWGKTTAKGCLLGCSYGIVLLLAICIAFFLMVMALPDAAKRTPEAAGKVNTKASVTKPVSPEKANAK